MYERYIHIKHQTQHIYTQRNEKPSTETSNHCRTNQSSILNSIPEIIPKIIISSSSQSIKFLKM